MAGSEDFAALQQVRFEPRAAAAKKNMVCQGQELLMAGSIHVSIYIYICFFLFFVWGGMFVGTVSAPNFGNSLLMMEILHDRVCVLHYHSCWGLGI